MEPTPKPGPSGRVSASPSETPVPVTLSGLDTTGGVPPEIPQTASPYDVWHSEGYLLRCLKRFHGWSQPEPNVLRRIGGR